MILGRDYPLSTYDVNQISVCGYQKSQFAPLDSLLAPSLKGYFFLASGR